MIAACLSSLYGFFESHQQASHGYIEIVNASILCYSDCKPNSGFEFFFWYLQALMAIVEALMAIFLSNN